MTFDVVWNQIVSSLLGPGGAVVALSIAIFFLWRLFREEQKENRRNFEVVSAQSEAIKALTVEIRAWREAGLGPRSHR